MSFKKIIGQERNIKFIQQAIAGNELPGAYLFLGIDGVGKGLTASTLAKAANCQKEKTDSCDECPSCKRIDNFNYPDVIRIDLLEGNSFIKIDQIRRLKYELSLKPFEGARKIAIVLEADFLNAESSNALLKTLEEPPGNSLLILTASNPSRIFSTIMSRCQIIKFFPLKDEDIKELLIKEHNMPENEAQILSRLSQGSIGGALRLKEKDILGKRQLLINNLIHQDNNFWENMFSLAAFKPNFLEILDILATWYRDLLVLKIGGGESQLVNFDKKEDLNTFGGNYSLESVDKIINLIFELRRETEQNLNPKLLCQRLLLEMEGAKI